VTTAELEGRTFIVTGANSGIGRATAVALARRGGRVHLACRSLERTEPVLDEIAALGGPGSGAYLALDLTDLAAVRAAAQTYRSAGEPLHVLVNNAGIAGQRGRTADGFELAFGVNHLGPFLFTTMLLDLITDSAPARVVTVASGSHYQARQLDLDRVRRNTSFTGLREYATSKLCNVLFTQELARRLEGTGVTTYALHPGTVASNIWSRIPSPVEHLMTRFMTSTEDGAATSLYCATSPEVAGESGLYYHDCAVRRPNALATPQLAAELWARSEQWTAA
jgi:NAD(P)-dependent dehydrogenase (short-subunit alcohol dehydrogenase family)